MADGEITATCEAGSEAGDLGVKPQSDTNEANFHGDVIKSQAPENLGVTAELAVGAGLDRVGRMHIVSPDLVCPDSGGEMRDVAVSGLDTGVKANLEQAGDENAESDEVISGVGGERAEEGHPADPVAEQIVVVGERTRVLTSNTEKKRLRWEMARREMERRRVARQKEREPAFKERLGGVESIVPDVGGVLCEEHVRAP